MGSCNCKYQGCWLYFFGQKTFLLRAKHVSVWTIPQRWNSGCSVIILGVGMLFLGLLVGMLAELREGMRSSLRSHVSGATMAILCSGWLSPPHLTTLRGQAGSTYSRIRIQRQLLVACAAGVETRTADRNSSRYRYSGTRRTRQLALDCEGN